MLQRPSPAVHTHCSLLKQSVHLEVYSKDVHCCRQCSSFLFIHNVHFGGKVFALSLKVQMFTVAGKVFSLSFHTQCSLWRQSVQLVVHTMLTVAGKVFSVLIVPFTEENETAMEDPVFTQLLLSIGLSNPASEQVRDRHRIKHNKIASHSNVFPVSHDL